MQFSGLATRSLSELGSWFFPYFHYDLTDLTFDSDFVCRFEGTGQDAIMPYSGKALG